LPLFVIYLYFLPYRRLSFEKLIQYIYEQ